MKKEPLGKGLLAILKDVEEKGASRLIPLSEIVPNPTQPRFKVNEDDLVGLASSIREKGVLQPILVRRKAKNYEIIAGERRYRASLLAGLKEVPAIVKDVGDREGLEIALIENLQREDLNPIELASIYQRFIEEFGYTQEEVGKKIGMDRSSVANIVRLLKLPDNIKNLISQGKLTQGHARVLVSLKDEEEQDGFVDKVLKEGFSVRELEREAKSVRAKSSSCFPDVAEALRDRLQTKVNIALRKNKGKIIIEFFSKDDLERIFDLILK